MQIYFFRKEELLLEKLAICRACTVQDQCLEYAVENSEKFGIWGGLSERERRRIKRQRAAEFDIRDVG